MSFSRTPHFFHRLVNSRSNAELRRAAVFAGVAVAIAPVATHRTLTQCSADDPNDAWSKLGSPAVSRSSRISRLLIVRHGETSWNAEARMQGQTDIELNDAGRLQAKQFAQRLTQLGVAEDVEAVVSSDLSRASATADRIATVCPGAARSIDHRLREQHFGVFQGKVGTDPDVARVIGKLQQDWAQGDFEKFPDSGESVASVVARGLEGMRSAAKLGSSVIIVAHGALIKWCTIGIELNSEAPNPLSMSSPRVKNLLHARRVNCCYCLVLYDHDRDTFHNARCFANLLDATLDDSG